MIKEGDKLVCIKNVIHDGSKTLTCIKDKIYIIKFYDMHDNTIFIYGEGKYGLWFKLYDIVNYTSTFYVYDYFITLAEWRNKQIDLILND